MGSKVELRKITRAYPGGRGVFDVSLEFPSSTYNVILGPSGSGKSTLLRIIAGLDDQYSGSVLIDGEPVDKLSPVDRGVAIVFQEPLLFPHLTVKENIAFPLLARGLGEGESYDKAVKVAKLLHISHTLRRKPDTLSGGEKQRVALARALVVEPNVLLLDEPYSNLDMDLREELRWEVKQLQGELGLTVIHVTHDQDEAIELADYVHLLREGRILDTGPRERVYKNPTSSEAARLLGHNILREPIPCMITASDKPYVSPELLTVTHPQMCGSPARLEALKRRRYYCIAVYKCDVQKIRVVIDASPCRAPGEACLDFSR
ncbi:MAG: ABC transporter ATP-binding protein [Desulfurococcales archaeon]|nr:ABC transporter ATP-binding protein [Desulfurococcales archaeon]